LPLIGRNDRPLFGILHMTKPLCLILLFSLCGVPLAAQSCDNTLFPIVKNRKLGFIDKSGREIIHARFADYRNFQYFPDLPQFSEGLAPVSENGRSAAGSVWPPAGPGWPACAP